MADEKHNETRSIDRDSEAPKTEGGAVTRRTGTEIVEDPGVSAQQIQQACGAAASSAEQATTALGSYLKPEVQRSRPRKAKPGTIAFATDMANLQKQYATELGHM